MKRTGNLTEKMAAMDNLRVAFRLAARGKRGKREVREFASGLERNLAALREGILEGGLALGRFHRFTVHEPKERRIHAAHFGERVLHHALMLQCGPALDRALIADTYACRPGLGRERAVRRARHYAARHGWFLKLDVARYFDSIRHDVLRAQLAAKFKDRRLLEICDAILATHESAPGRGLPIGSLTSQHWANHYLAAADRLVKEKLRMPGYVRYMDDFVLWHDDRAALRTAWQTLATLLRDRLGLELKSTAHLQPTRRGMDFLGYRVFPDRLELNRRSRRRFRRRMAGLVEKWDEGAVDDLEFQRRSVSLTAFTRLARAETWRRNILAEFRAPAIGLQPRQPGRLVEQRRRQLPLGQPQQLGAGQSQQQPRLPPCPQLSTGPEGPWN